jgi:hypothetical protein
MLTHKKVLIATPTSEHKDYCFKDWAYMVKHLTYPSNILIVDNSINPLYHKKIKNEGFNVVYAPALEGELLKETMCRCNNICRDYVLAEKFDYMFSLESDVFIPDNTIEYLLSLKRKVCGLPYFIGHVFESKVLAFEIEDFGGDVITQTYSADRAFLELFDGSIKNVYQPGIGCLLIDRSVLDKVKFRIGDETNAHADVFFHIDLKKLNINVYVSTALMAHHQNGNWTKINAITK